MVQSVQRQLATVVPVA